MRNLRVVAVMLAAGACASGRSDGPDRQKQLETEAAALRHDIDQLTRRVQELRGRTDGPLQSALPGGSAVVAPGGDVGGIRLEWSSQHAGVQLSGVATPQGGGERARAAVQVHR